jgi:peptidoglycan/LPS O-acetylase OafA/YrhL
MNLASRIGQLFTVQSLRERISMLRRAAPEADITARPLAPNDKSAASGNEPPWIRHGEIPCINGLRALSILIVIASHFFLRDDGAPTSLRIPGEMGVEVFFVISGFLITLLLIREKSRSGIISLKNFYLRRTCRIIPAYVLFLATLFLLQMYGSLNISGRAWTSALTYTSSIFSPVNWYVGHTWSLSVEEHFYLVWPLLFSVLGPKKSFFAATACITLTPLVRIGIYSITHHNFGFDYFTPTRLDAIAVGCCLAYLVSVSAYFRRITRLSKSVAVVATVAGVALLVGSNELVFNYGTLRPVHYYGAFFASTVRPLIISCLLWVLISNDAGWLTRLLNWKPVAFVGVLSYSLYLWQQVFLNPKRNSWFCQWPYNAPLIVAAALFSYYVIERPFLRYKKYLTIR